MKGFAKKDRPDASRGKVPRPEASASTDQAPPPCPGYPQHPMVPAPEPERTGSRRFNFASQPKEQ
jgi:hypothetical protein